MGFEEGRVIFDKPDGTYFAGQTVKGRLEFNENYIMTFRGLYVLMKGFCDVNWRTTHMRKVEDRNEEYTVEHNSHEVYYEQKVYFAGGSQGQHSLGVGHHVFPFECRIPPHCPSSFKGSYGCIQYIFKFVVDRPSQTDLEKTGTICVISQRDLNAEPHCRQPMNFHFQESYCCCCMTAGGCEVVAKVPASGYCCKQNIPIVLNVENKSSVKIKLIIFEIKQMISYTATNPSSGKKLEDNTIATLKKGPIPGKTTRNWDLNMTVPDMDFPNTEGSKFIDIYYIFKVIVSPSGCHTNSEDSRRIFLGHIPLQDFNGTTNQLITPVQQFPPPPPYPGVNPSFQGANTVYPGVSPVYPVPNPPYPSANPTYPGGNPQFSGYPQPNPWI